MHSYPTVSFHVPETIDKLTYQNHSNNWRVRVRRLNWLVKTQTYDCDLRWMDTAPGASFPDHLLPQEIQDRYPHRFRDRTINWTNGLLRHIPRSHYLCLLNQKQQQCYVQPQSTYILNQTHNHSKRVLSQRTHTLLVSLFRFEALCDGRREIG